MVLFGYSGFFHHKNWSPCYNWNIAESGVKHNKSNQIKSNPYCLFIEWTWNLRFCALCAIWQNIVWFIYKNSLTIPKGQPETANLRTYNTNTTRKKTKGQTRIYITLHRIRKFKQHEPHKNRDNTDALQWLTVPAALETTVALLLNNIKVDDGFTIYIDMHLPSRLSSRPGTHLKCLQFQTPTHDHGISSVSL